MGGHNSGRRPEMWDTRGQVEDAAILDAASLRRLGAFACGAAGILKWEDGNRVEFRCDGSTITLNYTTRGRAYCQHIQLSSVPLNWSRKPSARPALLCSECGYRGYKLYFSKRQPYFLCRACQHLIYEIQTYNSLGMCHALLKVLKEERSMMRWSEMRRSSHAKRRHMKHET
jgi:hypothetical protein